MKATLSPELTARLERIIADLDAFVADVLDPRVLDSPFYHGKLGTASGDLAFVAQSTRRGMPDVQVMVLEREAVARS